MTDSNGIECSDGASSKKSGNSLLLKNKLAESGDFLAEDWADLFGVDVKTVSEWVRKKNIPTFGPSKKNYMINVSDFRTACKKE